VDDSDRTERVQPTDKPSTVEPEAPIRRSVTRHRAPVLVDAIVHELRCGTGAAVPSARHRSRFQVAHTGAAQGVGVGSRPVAPDPRMGAVPPCRVAAGWLPLVSANHPGGDLGQPPGVAVVAGWRTAAGPCRGR
jgi:hypothetical protein